MCDIEVRAKKKLWHSQNTFKNIVAHCKEYGFVFPSSEIYDGLGAVYDYITAMELKNNIKRYWWDSMTLLHDNVVGLDSAIFMPLYLESLWARRCL